MFPSMVSFRPPTSGTGRRVPKELSPPHPSALQNFADSLEPAMNGPPSPERIRAYTEQMKRSSIFTHNNSSATSSYRSGNSSSGTAENMNLSRQSSQRSSISTISRERPDSIHAFGKALFSRSKKGRRSTVGTRTLKVFESWTEAPPRDTYSSKGTSRSGMHSSHSSDDFRKQISDPFNFQHVTHTRQEHMPNLVKGNEVDLATEFSAMRASQVPVNQLKGIQADDLHFDNFSSDAINSRAESSLEQARPLTSPQRPRNILRKPTSPPLIIRRPTLTTAKSYESLPQAISRPLRSPIDSSTPAIPPPRVSSRTVSTIWDDDPLTSTTLTRPHTNAGFRRSTAFHLPLSPPLSLVASRESFILPTVSSLPRTPDASWPLQGNPMDSPQLDDVPEEDEVGAARRSRFSIAGSDLRSSKSVPNLLASHPPSPGVLHEEQLSTLMSPINSCVTLSPETWEEDIDYCYEHEAEADCEYEWDRCSMDEGLCPSQGVFLGNVEGQALSHDKMEASPAFNSHFRSSLVAPSSPCDLPELSPVSISDSLHSPGIRTPSTFLRPAHMRSTSRTSSFKESHGFTLSPSLLIPTDFASQMMDNEIYYPEHQYDLTQSHHYEAYPASPVEGSSSSASFRSSGFSRVSNAPTLSKSGSHESVLLLSRAALQHRSNSSMGSVPDLVHSRTNRDDMPRDDPNELFLPTTPTVDVSSILSPVSNLTLDCNTAPARVLSHSRKSSAPPMNTSSRDGRYFGRRRAATMSTSTSASKGRASYGLFPTVS